MISDYLKHLALAKLIDKRSLSIDYLDRIDVANLILDHLDYDSTQINTVMGTSLGEQLLTAIYFHIIQPNASLFFFRCSELTKLLDLYS